MQETSLWLWVGFNAFILAMLALDLGVFHRKSHEVSLKEATIWSAVWVALAMVFNAGVFYFRGTEQGLQFFTGYLIEKSLSVDNIFVFALIFSFFAVPKAYQHRVLFWGILGALVMRAVFIAAGAALLTRFHWIIYVFGAFLLITGIKMAIFRNPCSFRWHLFGHLFGGAPSNSGMRPWDRASSTNAAFSVPAALLNQGP